MSTRSAAPSGPSMRFKPCGSSSGQTLARPESSRASMFSARIRLATASDSTKSTRSAPRERASMPSAPEPANRSTTFRSWSGSRIMNSASRTRSEVGPRPTSDRVREALFMILEPLQALKVVALFAGSGALGIEALSRGAERVDFVESDAVARRILAENIEALELSGRARVWPLELPQGLKRIEGPLGAADLVLMDPPYG